MTRTEADRRPGPSYPPPLASTAGRGFGATPSAGNHRTLDRRLLQASVASLWAPSHQSSRRARRVKHAHGLASRLRRLGSRPSPFILPSLDPQLQSSRFQTPLLVVNLSQSCPASHLPAVRTAFAVYPTLKPRPPPSSRLFSPHLPLTVLAVPLSAVVPPSHHFQSLYVRRCCIPLPSLAQSQPTGPGLASLPRLILWVGLNSARPSYVLQYPSSNTHN